MPNKFEVNDPRGRRVTCTERAWDHITADRSWMDTEDWLQDVRQTIERPTMGIFHDADFEDRIVYYAFNERGRGRYLKVVVRTVDDKNGDVITAHTLKTPKAEKN